MPKFRESTHVRKETHRFLLPYPTFSLRL